MGCVLVQCIQAVTVWDFGHSPTRQWYYSLLNNEEISAPLISLKVAVINVLCS